MSTNPLKKIQDAVRKKTPHEICDHGNAILEKIGRNDVEWIVRDGRPLIVWKKSAATMLIEDGARKPRMERRGQPMSESDTFALNKELEKLGATKRYRPDGSKYDAAGAG